MSLVVYTFGLSTFPHSLTEALAASELDFRM